MRKLEVWVAACALCVVGNAMAEVNDGLGRFVKPKPVPSASQPATGPAGNPAAPAAAVSGSGEVVSKVDGAGYSYLELSSGGKTYWIAGTQIDAKKGDRVRYDENVVMENFFSKTLNRSFDRIIFASAVRVEKK